MTLNVAVLIPMLYVMMECLNHIQGSIWHSGLATRGCQEPRAPLNAPAAPSNFCREPKDLLVSP